MVAQQNTHTELPVLLSVCLLLFWPTISQDPEWSYKYPEIQLTRDNTCLPQCFISAQPWSIVCIQEVNWQVKLCLTYSQSSGLRLLLCDCQLFRVSTGREVPQWWASVFSLHSHGSCDPGGSLLKLIHSSSGCRLASESSCLSAEVKTMEQFTVVV